MAVHALAGFVIAAVLALAPLSARADDAVAMDYQVKAACLVNFPKYVDWPAAAFASPSSPITVAVFGDDNVANEFASMVEDGKAVNGHPIVLKRVEKESDITADCQILFIGAAQRDRVPAILEKLQGTKVLTVGESPDFLQKGGIINLVHQGRKIRLQVNLDAAGQARLKISSKLLIAADVVKGKSS
jgi:hypothetical protein